MAMNEVGLVSTLMSIDLFDGLDVGQAQHLRDASQRRSLPAGQALTEPLRVDERLWVFLRGRLRIESAAGVGLVDVTEPRVLGEMGVLLGLPRSSRVVAEEDTDLLELTSGDLEELVLEDPNIGQQLLGNLCRTLYARLHELSYAG